MRIAVCGGPYGNPYALRAFVADARARGCERLFCLGDLGGFGAEVDALWPILAEAGVECVAGNYDVALARGDADCGCGYRDDTDNLYAQLIYDHTLATTSREFAAWMGRLPTERRERIAGRDVHLVHGSPLFLNDFWWASRSAAEHAQRVAASGAELICCTHTGLPWQRRIGDTLVVNVGVLGKPANDGATHVWYAVIDLDAEHIEAELVPLDYNWVAQAASMRAAGLPEAFVETIETGWWTTCLEVLPPAERAQGRYQLYRSSLPTEFAAADGGWGPAPAGDDERPVIPLFGSAWFPARLWIYSNFHCNLACSYCAVASSPKAPARSLPAAAIRDLVAEAVDAEFAELYLTGGEPFLHPEIAEILTVAAAALPTVVLTNAMLLTGRRGARLAELADRKLTIQTSLDGAQAATHDRLRGAGSWRRTIAGIEHLVGIGMVPRVAFTQTAHNAGEVPALLDLLAGLGVPADRVAVRPLLRRGLSTDGLHIDEDSAIPELTVSADGLHWHPAGADAGTSPDMHLAGPGTSLAAGRRLIAERFFHARLRDGSLPMPVNCAI
ncbi:MAG: radical SAM protein [Sporichthyaceae bacterium]